MGRGQRTTTISDALFVPRTSSPLGTDTPHESKIVREWKQIMEDRDNVRVQAQVVREAKEDTWDDKSNLRVLTMDLHLLNPQYRFIRELNSKVMSFRSRYPRHIGKDEYTDDAYDIYVLSSNINASDRKRHLVYCPKIALDKLRALAGPRSILVDGRLMNWMEAIQTIERGL